MKARVFVTLKNGVLDPQGKAIGFIRLPERCANLEFGGPKRNRLYITAQTSLYSIFLNAHPAGWQG